MVANMKGIRAATVTDGATDAAANLDKYCPVSSLLHDCQAGCTLVEWDELCALADTVVGRPRSDWSLPTHLLPPSCYSAGPGA